jgi:hypothetical protein
MKHAVAESVADVIARVARERNLQALCTPTMKPKVTYEFSRLCFRADVIEPLGDDDRFCVMTPEGKFVMTKRQFYSVFANVVQTRSYLKHGIYHYPKTPRKADPFCHPS